MLERILTIAFCIFVMTIVLIAVPIAFVAIGESSLFLKAGIIMMALAPIIALIAVIIRMFRKDTATKAVETNQTYRREMVGGDFKGAQNSYKNGVMLSFQSGIIGKMNMFALAIMAIGACVILSSL